MGKKNPWQWVTFVSLIVLALTGIQWRRHHVKAATLRDDLTALEQTYRIALSKLKKTKEQQKRLQYDVDQYTAENNKLDQAIQTHEGSTAEQSHATIDSAIYAQSEALEEVYLNRIDELQDQIVKWNSKTVYKEFRHRFPIFVVTLRVVGGTVAAGTHIKVKIRFANIKTFPVEIASLSQMVKRNQWEEGLVQMRFGKRHSSSTSTSSNQPILRLEQLDKPSDFPDWPIRHTIMLEIQHGSWFVVTDPAPSVVEHNAGTKNFAQIVEGVDVLQRFVQSSDQSLVVQVLAAERVAS